MNVETVPDTDLSYYLVAFDEDGNERTDDPDSPSGRLSEIVLEHLRTNPFTDVFLMCHGWKGDLPAAKEQYQRWLNAMLRCTADCRRIREVRADFRPLLLGLHWPSLPFGEEDFSIRQSGFAAPDKVDIQTIMDQAAATISDSPRSRQALTTILLAAANNIRPPHLPPEVATAFRVLNEEAGLGSAGVSGAPGDDREEFDPGRFYQNSLRAEAVSFGQSGLGGLLGLLQQLSFWKMKKRACRFGETGASTFLRDLQRSVPDDRHVYFHLMGHSFGCIAVSAAVAALLKDKSTKPIDSLFLVQGALSLWSFCQDIPVAPGTSGYFYSVVRDHKVDGPIVTTQSEHDRALRKLYPLGAGAAGQIEYGPGEQPRYGAIGTFGVQGPGVNPRFLTMLHADKQYEFQHGGIYNLESSQFICEGTGISGAHSDIAKPEIAHAFWATVIG
jgi:hypothetical protein